MRLKNVPLVKPCPRYCVQASFLTLRLFPSTRAPRVQAAHRAQLRERQRSVDGMKAHAAPRTDHDLLDDVSVSNQAKTDEGGQQLCDEIAVL